MTRVNNALRAACAAMALVLYFAPTGAAYAADDNVPDSIAVQAQKDIPKDWAKADVVLPIPAFMGTPSEPPRGMRMYKAAGERKRAKVAPFFAPKGAENLALKKKVTSSDKDPINGKPNMITDGDKEAMDGSWVEFAPGLQWVQIDLGQPSKVYGIFVWHKHELPHVYKDVVIQLSDDEDFITNVRTVFNNDDDNSSGLGLGQDMCYFETNEGWQVNVKGEKARYVRLYSNGSSSNDQNHYTEVEVWGLKTDAR